ncbi:GNAT family N-acetyltransferase [Nocardioides sp.]|uniref:GNAT family N-acetyltransferase n=1 Tax=Nocardioides sp. TaxID=35761 RepID=UPI002ED3D38B
MTIEVSTDPDRLDVDRIHRWLSEDAYWALGRPREVVVRSIAGSVNFGAYVGDELVGYARLVTDRATHAWLCDVYVDRPHRGRGVGSALLAAVDEQLASYGVGRAVLATHDAHDVYARFGFAPLTHPERWMARSYQEPRP